MNDRWERDNGLNATIVDGTGNRAGDAFSNIDEYTADTAANDGGDYFRITSISNNAVYFGSSDARWYTLLGCTNLVGANWQLLFEVTTYIRTGHVTRQWLLCKTLCRGAETCRCKRCFAEPGTVHPRQH